MEFDGRFLEVKAVLEQFEVRTGVKLESFEFSNTEETRIHTTLLIDSLRKIKLMTGKEDDDRRRLHLFLLVNTVLPVSNILEEDRDWCHLIGRCPKLSPFSYYTIVYRLGLFPFMAETVLYAPNQFSEALLDVFIYHIKHALNPYDELTALDLILTSVYKKLSYNVSVQSGNFKLVKLFQEVLLMFKKPSQLTSQKLESWSDMERHKYYGFLVLSLISTLFESTRCSFGKSSAEDIAIKDFDNLYSFSSFKVSQTAAGEDENLISECYEMIVAVSKTLMMEKISSNAFLDWCEVDITETRTLQRVVGEKIYLCRRALIDAMDANIEKNLKNSLSDLTYCLSHLEVKPLSLAEEIKDMNFVQLLSKFNDTYLTNTYEDNAFILRTLLEKDEAYDELAKVIEVLKKSCAFMKYDDIKYLIHRYNPNSSPRSNKLPIEFVETIFESLKILPVEEQISLLEEYLKANDNCQPYSKDSINFDEKLVEVFNKFVSCSSSRQESQFLSEIVFLCFFSIGDVVVKTLMECLQNGNYIKDMVPILKTLRPSLQIIQSYNSEYKTTLVQKISADEGLVRQILDTSHGDFLIDLLHILIFDEDTKQNAAKRSTLLDLVNYLIDESVIEKNIFYLEVVLNNIYLSPSTSNITLNFLLQFLIKGLVESPDESLDIEVHVVLIQLSQLLEKIRWEQENFASWRSAMVSNLVFLISSIVKKNSSHLAADSKKSMWMESHMKTFSAQTQFLFAPEFLRPSSESGTICLGKELDAFAAILNAIHNDKFDLSALSKFGKTEMAWAFFMVLSTSCDEEWNLLSLSLNRNKFFKAGDSALSFFNLMLNAFLVGVKLMEMSVSGAEDQSKSRHLINCYHHALVNLNSFLGNFLLKYLLKLSTPTKVHCFKKLSLLLQIVPDKIKSQCSILFLKTLISFIPHLVEDIDNNAKAVLFIETVYSSIHKLDMETRQLFARKAESFLREKVPAVFS